MVPHWLIVANSSTTFQVVIVTSYDDKATTQAARAQGRNCQKLAELLYIMYNG
jgi:hypothetical protein